jgi:V8-like Glu-specific endopeptidase
MRNVLLTGFTVSALSLDLQAQLTRHIDVKNLFPNAGVAVLSIDPNQAGVPPGVTIAASGVLIGERVFLTAAHTTRPSEDGVPPFIHVFVTFNLHALDDRSSWIPVVAQTWHPSSLPCPHNVCNWPEQPFPYPGLHDVGLMFLASPVKFTKPARLAPPGTVEAAAAEKLPDVVVGYGVLNLNIPDSDNPLYRHYVETEAHEIYDDASLKGGMGEICKGDSGGPVFLGTAGESGSKRRLVAGVVSGYDGPNCARGVDYYARVDTEEMQAWINGEIAKFLSQP